MRFLTILCLMLVATKFGASLAHVAELPGKLRLDEATYKAVQLELRNRWELSHVIIAGVAREWHMVMRPLSSPCKPRR
jgi:hypothetical protein